ncbi:hypothetical protein NQ315_002071 [Exocentrus adspersus]|uniref:C2H2-type domain-containing protein n=1 Tax=Exocentrus adspersus TaxID=1586481 RepID=A0AAV8V312_9CUCU|nr:hypothetical protein NQ315_002071 [Exocentrus adspersus]
MYSIKKFRDSDTICVVCCNKTCLKRDFVETGEVANEILDMLLLERDQTPVEGSVMCLKCSQKVNIIFEFKSACLYVEDFITPFINAEEGNRIDLKEVFMRQKDNKDLIDALLGRDLCRLCMSVVDDNECVYLDSSDLHVKFVKEMIKRCIPEINVNNTRNAIVCGTCVGCLKDFCNFMEGYSESRSSNRLKTHTLIHKKPSEIEWFKCHLCDYKAKQKVHLKSHTLVHKNSSEIVWFECDLCDYKSKHRGALTRHTVIHKNPSEIKWFECHLCDYKAKCKRNLDSHMFTHKDTSEIGWFECDSCNFKSKRKGSLIRHIKLAHRSR